MSRSAYIAPAVFPVAFILGCAPTLSAAEPDKQGIEFFEKKIRPVLVNHCYECHSAKSKKVKGGLLLDTRDGIRDGGESGEVIVPGNPKGSLLLDSLRYETFEMPPDGKLSDAVIADFAKWIKAQHADDLCVLAGMHTDIANHTPAMLQLHTGSFQFTRPSMGAWIMYGLGTDNQNLPGFVSMCPPSINGGTKNYGSAFLPAVYQGTAIGDIKTNIKDAKIGNIRNSRLSADLQRRQLDLVQSLNRDVAERDPADSQLDGEIESFELAFRMQSELPGVMDLAKETKETQEKYGIGNGKPSDNFGRQCLLARRMAEAGVRCIELCDEFWDQHGQLKKGHESRAAATDQPIGALLADLKQRGMLKDTLVLWGGEFCRTPDTARGSDGRDHNANGYTMFMAGGGAKGGFKYGGTDELGYEAVENRTHLHDMHATMLHLMGLEHTKLTYRYAGRDFRLTDIAGNVVHDIVA